MKFVFKSLTIVGVAYVLLAILAYLVEMRADYTLADAFWFTAVTITTVGYGDISPSTFGGRTVAVMMFVFSVAVFSFLVTSIQKEVAERQRQKELGMDGTDFKGHVVICAWTLIGQVALKELLAAGRQVAVICDSADTIPLVRTMGDKRILFVTVGDATSEETLDRVNIRDASTVIAASNDDTENLILALQIRHTNPNARIVVAIKRSELRNTLTASGVTYVASPFELSGRLVASAAFEPEVAKFIEDVSSGAESADEDDEDAGYDLQQFSVPPGSQLVDNTAGYVADSLKKMDGPLLVAVAKHKGAGQFKVYPHPDHQMVLNPHDSIIVLGNDAQNGRVAQMLGVIQGR